MKITPPSIPSGEYRVTHDPDKFDSSLDELYVLTGPHHEAITLATVNVRPFAPHLSEPLAIADCIAALPDLLTALSSMLQAYAPRCLYTERDEPGMLHSAPAAALSALRKAGCTIEP